MWHHPILKAILRGVHDPVKLAKLRDPRCKNTEATIAQALHGSYREEHLFALQQAVQLYDFYQQQLQECDAQLQACLGTFADASGGQVRPPRKRRQRRTGCA